MACVVWRGWALWEVPATKTTTSALLLLLQSKITTAHQVQTFFLMLTLIQTRTTNCKRNKAVARFKLDWVPSYENWIIAWLQGNEGHSPPPSPPPPLPLSDRGSACPLSSRSPLAPPSRPISFLHDIICTSVVPTGCWWHRQATKLAELSPSAFCHPLLLPLSLSCWSFPLYSLYFHPSVGAFSSCFSLCPCTPFFFYTPLLHHVL